MDLHNHYLRFSTVNISLLQTINKSISIHHLIQSYNYEMTKEELDINKLEFCRLLLCYEYQSVFYDIERSDKKHKKHVTSVNVEELNFPSVKMIFPPNSSRNISQISLLCDIINLQMILYCNISSIKQYLQNFLYSNDMYTTTNNSRIMYMKILEHLLEFLCLYQLHTTNKDSKAILESLGHIYLEIIKSWLKLKEDCEWRQFALMFPKLVEIFTPSCIVFPLWNHFLYEINDLKESLIGLSIMADICFTLSNSMNYIQCDIYCNNTFWLLILRGLRSPLQQHRKQALYIMKKAIGSMSTNVILNFESQLNVTKAEITPFICNNSDTSLSIDDIKEKFFLLYEALEEKKEHLITPTLIHAAALIKINKEHKACNCFNIIWLQCIFEKILLHENNHIAKWGVSYVCKLDKTMFDDQFLELFIHVLNNNFLYECQPDEKCPGIVKELSQFLEYAEKSDLLNRFVKKISCVAWGPVAIFYIVHVLRTVSHHESQHSDWQSTELNAIKFLVETNLSMHSRILRTASQTELLRAIPNYVRKINNLSLLANVLATFPSGESLTRGTVPWNVITTWLEKVLAREDVVTFIKETCAKYLNQDASPEINPRTFAIMVYLLYDANLIFLCQTCPDVEALNNWLYTLNSINVRPYADVILSMNVVEFISYLLYLSPKGSHNNMTDFISLHIRITFNFLIKNIRKMSTELSYEDYTRYTTIISSHIVNAPFLMSKKDVNIYAEKLQNESINLIHDLQNLNIQYLYGLHILYLSQNILILPLTKTFYIKRLLNTRMNIHNNINEEKILKGKMASEYDLLLLKLLHQYLINSPVPSWIPITTILSNLLQFLEVGSPENVSEIAKILTVINDNKIINNASDKETLEYIFNLSFTYIINSKRNNIFWTAIENLMGVIINNNFLLLLNAIQFTKRYVVKLLNEGENTPRFKRILLSKMKNLDIHNLMKFENVLGNCFLHGSVHRRDKKIENYAHLFIENQLNKYYSKHIFTLDHNNDAAIRAEAVILLHRIISNPEFNYAASFGQSVLNELIKNKTKRYFKDSPLHKLKHRIMQILLILEPVLSKEFVPLLQEQLCEFIFSESNQSSVKIMQEWLLIRIFTKNIHLHDKLWSLFAKSIKDRPRCTISVASIVYHVAKLLSRDNQRIFIQTALPYIVQCCLGQQFNARFILTQLYELMKANYGDNSISEYRGIYQAAVIGLQQESLIKNSSRIQDDFYFSNFHPFNDYCLQTIYYQLPRLTNVSCDEWISSDVFKDLMFMENDCHPLQLCNTGSFLTKSIPSVYLTKSFAGDTHGDSLKNNVEIYMEGLNDIQKKIDPSKPIGLCGDTFEVINEFMFLQDTQLQQGLIVVASFVDRSPNLGGIARTCEIFGVKALVVANADCVKDKEFQYLSVSADKWLNILQVKPYELQKFLLDRKNTGWSLIGVEQTVNSTNLMTTTFEKRTILVLGNEKDGIPANFIPLFDKCVEIPQVGVTRSLNVHVTAAICIWQYANQHILK
ncbi:TARB1 methyltransferase, partial [Acromyrmex insinuator]